MNKKEVMKLALESGLIRTGDGWTEPHRWGMTEIERFADLVAAADRSTFNFCPRCGKRNGPSPYIHTCTPPADGWAYPTNNIAS